MTHAEFRMKALNYDLFYFSFSILYFFIIIVLHSKFNLPWPFEFFLSCFKAQISVHLCLFPVAFTLSLFQSLSELSIYLIVEMANIF